MRGQKVVGEADAFAAEKERIAGLKSRVEVASLGRGREQEPPSFRQAGTEVGKIEAALYPNEVPIVDARAAHGLFIDAKTEEAHQVEDRCRRGAEAGDVSRVRRDFWLHENH